MRKVMAMAMCFGLMGVCAAKANADEVTTTTQQTTVTSPAVLPLQPVQPDSRVEIYSTSTRPASSSESYIVKEPGGNEKYAHRLGLMLDQINMAAGKGCISSAQADRLRARESDLASLEASVRSRGFEKSESDDLEKQMNVFNVDISHTLSAGTSTAGAGMPQ